MSLKSRKDLIYHDPDISKPRVSHVKISPLVLFKMSDHFFFRTLGSQEKGIDIAVGALYGEWGQESYIHDAIPFPKSDYLESPEKFNTNRYMKYYADIYKNERFIGWYSVGDEKMDFPEISGQDGCLHVWFRSLKKNPCVDCFYVKKNEDGCFISLPIPHSYQASSSEQFALSRYHNSESKDSLQAVLLELKGNFEKIMENEKETKFQGSAYNKYIGRNILRHLSQLKLRDSSEKVLRGLLKNSDLYKDEQNSILNTFNDTLSLCEKVFKTDLFEENNGEPGK